MEYPILITWLNDFIFCPASIYFHNLYGNADKIAFQDTYQINGTNAHANVDAGTYSTSSHILSGISVYCDEYNLTGKIDIFDINKGLLVERKKKINAIYDGYIFQIYAQCLALREMGYSVKKMVLRSISDNKAFPVSLPEDNPNMFSKFEATIIEMKNTDLSSFKQENIEKCRHCIYEPLCSNSLLVKE